MASQIPTIPRIVFTVLEPISLVAGSFAALFTSTSFIDEQIPALAYSGQVASAASQVVAQQLGNMYMLSALVGLALFSTSSDVKPLKAYLAALWVADVGHIAVTVYGLGWEGTMDYASWNALTWGNIGATVSEFIHFSRCNNVLTMHVQRASSVSRGPYIYSAFLAPT